MANAFALRFAAFRLESATSLEDWPFGWHVWWTQIYTRKHTNNDMKLNIRIAIFRFSDQAHQENITPQNAQSSDHIQIVWCFVS